MTTTNRHSAPELLPGSLIAPRTNSEDFYETIPLSAASFARVLALHDPGIFICRSVHQHWHCAPGAPSVCSAAMPYGGVYVDARLLGLRRCRLLLGAWRVGTCA